MAYYMGHEYTPAAARPARYHVGDLVRVVKSGGEEGGSYHGAEVGDTDEIIAVNMTCDSPYEGKIWLYKEHEIVPAFRPGDRVKLNKHYGARACGERGTVSFVNGDRIGVRMDEPTWWGAVAVAMPDGVLDWEREDEQAADCAERKEQPCIVAMIAKDGKPRPSQCPYVHASLTSATTEAERLARKHPGQEFAVYQRVAGRIAEQHIEMKEVA